MTDKKFLLGFYPFLLLIVLALGACTEASPVFGQYFRGRVLDLSVVTLERTPELLYSTVDAEQVKRHYRIRPSAEDLELVLVRLKVENHTATSAIVSIDAQAAELRGLEKDTLERIKLRPFNYVERAEEVSAPENPGAERVLQCPQTDHLADGRSVICPLWNGTSDNGAAKAFVLPKNTGLEGWLVFEAPKKTNFLEFRWRAGDSLTIDF